MLVTYWTASFSQQSKYWKYCANLSFNPYSAKGLGGRLYAILHKMPGESATHFVYFWSLKTLPYTHLEATSYIPHQGQSLPIWTTSLFTTGCYKNKYTIQFLWMACISWSATAILSGETELALDTIRVKKLDIMLLKDEADIEIFTALDYIFEPWKLFSKVRLNNVEKLF